MRIVGYLPMSLLDLKRIVIVSIVIAAVDVAQSFRLQTQAVNPMSELNSLPYQFFQHGWIGYLAYIPVEALSVFVLLFVMWSLACIVFKGKDTWS